MSVHIIYYKDGAKMMRPVLSRPEYLALRNSGDQIHNVAAIREGIERLKSRLVQMNYSCLPNADGSLKGTTAMSNTVGMDIDHIEAAELQPLRDRILSKKDELGLLMLELSARGAGYHLVFRRRPELTQEENLRWASDVLGVKYDEGAKDITRVFFTTTASEEDLIWLDDEIFKATSGELAPSQPPRGEALADAKEAPSQPPRGEELADANEKVSANQIHSAPSLTGRAGGGSAALYHNIPYATIVKAWIGAKPIEAGDRHRTSLILADHLRYITDNDAVLIEQILRQTPFVDEIVRERDEDVAGTVKAACAFKMFRSIPKRMQSALESVGITGDEATADAQPASDSEALPPTGERGEGPGLLPPMPKRLPPLIKLLVSRTPDIYQAAVAHAVFPSLATHLHRVRFPYIDNVEHEATLMNVLMAGTGAGKDCISEPINRIMADIRLRDEENLRREREWKREVTSKGANKDKRQRPEGLVIQEIDADMTNPAFVMRMAEADGHFLYTKMNELDQFDALRGSGATGKQQFQIMCPSFDPGNRYGQTRVGVQSVTEKVCIRFNWNASTTIQKGQQYFSRVLTDGPVSRINFCTIPEREIGADMPVYGTYDAAFDEQLRPYIDNLVRATGRIECPQATRLAKRLVKECAEFATLSQSRVYENLSFRANVIAYLKAMVLYVAHGCQWSKDIEEFVRWSLQYDLWCKMQFFGKAIAKAMNEPTGPKLPGPRNMLMLLDNEFCFQDVVNVRLQQELSREGTAEMIRGWKRRKYIEVRTDGQMDRYVKLKYRRT